MQLKAFALSPSGERLENPTTIEIVVLDQNDNRPAFTQSQFTGTVPEFSIPGNMHCADNVGLAASTALHLSLQVQSEKEL